MEHEVLKKGRLAMTLDAVFSSNIKEDIDDTLLQKLISALDNEASMCLINLDQIVKALAKKDMGSQALTFASRLIRTIFKNSELSTEYATRLLTSLDITNNLDSPTVREATLQLLSFCPYNQIMQRLISESGLVSFGWSCLDDTSIFVRRAAELFLASVLRSNPVEDPFNDVASMKKELTDEIVKRMANKDTQLAVVKVALRLCEYKLDFHIVDALYDNFDLQSSNDIGSHVLALCLPRNRLSDFEKMLVESKRCLELLTFAYYLIKKRRYCPDEWLNRSYYLLRIPMQIFTEDAINDDRTVEEAFRSVMSTNKSTSLKLLLRSLEYYKELFSINGRNLPIEPEVLKTTFRDHVKALRMLTKTPTNSSLPFQFSSQKLLLTILEVLSKCLILAGNDELEIDEVLDISLNILKESVCPSSNKQAIQILAQIVERDGYFFSNGRCDRLASFFAHDSSRDLTFQAIDKLFCWNGPEIMDFEGMKDLLIKAINFHSLWALLFEPDSMPEEQCLYLHLLNVFSYKIETWSELGINPVELITHLNRIFSVPDADLQEAILNVSIDLLLNFEENVADQVYPLYRKAIRYGVNSSVRCRALGVWRVTRRKELRLMTESNKNYKDLIAKLRSMGYLSSLAYGLTDCDRVVIYDACKEGKELMEALASLGYVQPKPIEPNNTSEEGKTSEPKPVIEPATCHVGIDIKVVEDVVDLDMYDQIVKMVARNQAVSEQNGDQGELDDLQQENLVWETDFDTLMSEAKRSSDLYDHNLLTLLDDILSHSETEGTNNDNRVDCY